MKIDSLELPLPKEPYRGILPFRLVDWRIFFEREAETQRLTNLVSLYRGVLLYGRSGAGKSSLLNAGLIPHALRQGRAPERIRVHPENGRDLLVEPINLQESDAAEHSENEPPRYLPSRFITSTHATDGVRLSCEEFSKTLHDPSDLGAPLLIFDQFEELVTLFEENPRDKEHFEQAHAARVEIEQLLYKLLVSESLPLKLVFAFRDDYFARLTPLFSRIPNLMDQTVRLELPGIELLHHIVRGPFLPSEERGLPAGHFRNKLGELDELSEKLADKIESGIRTGQPSDVLNLSEVQTLCLALWQQPKRREELLRADNPAAVLRRIIRSEAMTSLKKKFWRWNRIRAIAVLSNLVTEDGTRNVVAHQMLVSQTRRNPMLWVFRGKWRKFLERLSETGLVRRSLTSGTTFHYELTSEFLIPQIQRWQQRFRMQRQIIVACICAVLIAVPWVEYVRATNAERAAKVASERAIQQKRIAQAETLLARKWNSEDMSAMEEMANRLAELSNPREARFWHETRASALSRLGMHEDAIKEYDAVLQLDPQNLSAKFDRAYEYYTQREPEKALEDTEAYLAKVPTSWIAHQNRGIYLSLRGQYGEAEKAIRNAIREFQFIGTEPVESAVALDIQKATGRTLLRMGENEGPNYYQLANLKAYAGSEEFGAVLTEADNQPHSADAVLFALNSALLQMENRKEDYGALVAQGALWDRAGFKEVAKKYYQDFERIHKETKEKRYDGLAQWAARQRAALKSVGPPPEEKASVDTLVLETQELIARNKWEDALTRINSAIDTPGGDAMLYLYLYRALIFVRLERYSESKADCDRILSKAPKMWLAHLTGGIANAALNRDPKIAEADLRKALEHNPGDGYSLLYLSDALYDRAEKGGFETSRPVLDEALQLLERSTSAEHLQFKDLPYIYYKIARIHRARGDFREAKKSLETAIAIKDDDSDFYTLWRETQKALGENEAQASCSLAGFHRQIAETKLHLGNSGKALDACWRGLEALTADEKQVNETEVKQEMAATMSEISQIIERAGSRAKATVFWQSMVELESMKLLSDGAKVEVQRLAGSR
jgi:tetratricopeptide (TPR) repeat protein